MLTVADNLMLFGFFLMVVCGFGKVFLVDNNVCKILERLPPLDLEAELERVSLLDVARNNFKEHCLAQSDKDYIKICSYNARECLDCKMFGEPDKWIEDFENLLCFLVKGKLDIGLFKEGIYKEIAEKHCSLQCLSALVMFYSDYLISLGHKDDAIKQIERYADKVIKDYRNS